MAGGFYGDYNQVDPLNWRFASGVSNDRYESQRLAQEFQDAVSRAPEAASETPNGGFDDPRGRASDGETWEQNTKAAAQMNAMFNAEAAKSQFYQSIGAKAFRPPERPTPQTRRRDGFTLRKDAIDIDFEEVSDEEEFPSGLRRITPVKPRPQRQQPLPRLGYGGGRRDDRSR